MRTRPRLKKADESNQNHKVHQNDPITTLLFPSFKSKVIALKEIIFFSIDTYLLVLHWLGVVLLCGYFGYAAGMLFGFSHRDEHGLRVIITYSFMMGFSFLLFLSEYRVACVTKNIGFVNNSFGMAMFYFMLAVFALIDDVAWWKWVLFGSMSSMSAAYIIGASCAHKTDDENDPVYAEYSPPRAVDKEV